MTDRGRKGDGERLLEIRARRLARPPTSVRPEVTLEVVSFELAGERYALAAEFVQEVFRLREIAAVPGAEPPFFGVTVWRGGLLRVLDLRLLLALEVRGVTDLSRVLVLGSGRAVVGVLADAVQGLDRIPLARIGKRFGGTPAAGGDSILGVTSDALTVLDAARILELHT